MNLEIELPEGNGVPLHHFASIGSSVMNAKHIACWLID